MKIQDFYSKYTKEEVLKHFLRNISDEKFEENKPLFYLFFVTSKEKNIPRSFVNDHLHLLNTFEPEELEYQTSRLFSQVISNYQLGDELIQEYGDKVNWQTLSARADINLEFIEKYSDKIEIKSIKADLGKEFIDRNLSELNPSNLEKMKLTSEQALKTVEIHKRRLYYFKDQDFFNKEFALANIKNFCLNEITNLLSTLELSFKEKMDLIPLCENKTDEENTWHEFLTTLMATGTLTLSQKKDIKWHAWI